MTRTVFLFHYGGFQPLWQQPGLIQVGPTLSNKTSFLEVSHIQADIVRSGREARGVLLHYTDPFLIRTCPLRGVKGWAGPKLLICGDLHHGERPLDVLSAYLEAEPHDAVLLSFNPTLLSAVRARIGVPVRSLPPTFFRYPTASRITNPILKLLHVGSLGCHHPRRRELVECLQVRGRVPFYHTTTASSEQAATLYAQYALVLNVPLNHDLNHRFFEVMAAGRPQVIFGEPSLLGASSHLALRPDVFWANTLIELEDIVSELLSRPDSLKSIPVLPPPYWEIHDLLKAAFAP